MPFDSCHRYPAEWRDKIFDIIDRRDDTAHRFIDALSWEMWRYEIAREEHTKRVKKSTYQNSTEKLEQALTVVLEELNTLMGNSTEGRPGSDTFFHALSIAKQKNDIESSGRKFLGYFKRDVKGLMQAISYGKNLVDCHSLGLPKSENAKPYRRDFAVKVAGLMEDMLGITAKNYCTKIEKDAYYMGSFAEVLSACLELLQDNQGLSTLVKDAIKAHRS